MLLDGHMRYICALMCLKYFVSIDICDSAEMQCWGIYTLSCVRQTCSFLAKERMLETLAVAMYHWPAASTLVSFRFRVA